MQSLRDLLVKRPPTDATPAEAEAVCPTCGGLKTVYVPTGRTISGLNGPMDDYAVQPCPACQPQCPRCGGLGVVGFEVPVGDPNFGRLMPCPEPDCPAVRALQTERQTRIVNYAQLPDEHAGHTFASFLALDERQREGKMVAFAAAQRFVRAAAIGHWVDRADLATEFGLPAQPEDRRNWLVFHGEPGRGKTGLAACIVNALAAEGRPVMYIRLQDWLDAVQRRYRPSADSPDDEFGADSASRVLDRVRSAPVLVIDEFDVPNLKPDDDKQSKVQAVINYRHNARLPTVLTTNLDEVSLRRRWSPMVASRICQRAHWLPMRGESLRPTPGAFDWE